MFFVSFCLLLLFLFSPLTRTHSCSHSFSHSFSLSYTLELAYLL